jgi:hypothetical protein
MSIKMAQTHFKKKMAQIVVTAQFKMGSPCLVTSLSLQGPYVSHSQFCLTLAHILYHYIKEVKGMKLTK